MWLARASEHQEERSLMDHQSVGERPATGVSRLDALLHAREIAEKVGAVKNGSHFFEFDDGGSSYSPEHGREVCGVCIAGAIELAEIALAGKAGRVLEDPFPLIYEQAVPLSDPPDDEGWSEDEYRNWSIAGAITEGGTPYVLKVLDAMIAAEREAVSA